MTDLLEQLRAYGDVLDRAEPGVAEVVEIESHRSHRRYVVGFVAAAAMITTVAIALPVANLDHHSKPRVMDVPTVPTPPTTVPALPDTGLRVADRFVYQQSVSVPPSIVISGGDAWIGVLTNNGPRVERRDATNGALKATIALPFVATAPVHLAAAGDGGVYVTGYLDLAGATGGLIEIDPTTNKATDPMREVCGDCPIAVGEGALWSINGATAVRIDTTTGNGTSVDLPARATAIAAVGNMIQVGMENAHVAVIDPSTNTMSADIDLSGPQSQTTNPGISAIVAASPNLAPDDSVALRSDGLAFPISNNEMGGTLSFSMDTHGLALDGDNRWAFGNDNLAVVTNAGDGGAMYHYDADTNEFTKTEQETVNTGNNGFQAIADDGQGNLWLARTGEHAEVLRIFVG